MVIKKTTIILVIGLAITISLPVIGFAQMRGGMGGMGGGMGGMGMGGGMYGGMMGGMMGGQGPGVVTVKYGEKVFDAVFGDLIDYKVYYIPIPADAIGVHYFDDGTHGDEVAYDGIPSLITLNDKSYLGPFSIRYKKQLKKALENAEKMGTLKFYNLNIATDMQGSKVTNLNDWDRQMKDILDGLRSRIAQFEGFDDQKYIKSIDPTMFETMEGMGSMSGGFSGPSGYLPDLPPPPGMPKLQQEGQEGTPEGGIVPGGAAPGATPPKSANPPAKRFDPIGRARGAAGTADSLTGGQLQATEAMNSMN